MTLSLYEFVNKMLRKKAEWKALDPKTRNLSSKLFIWSIRCLVIVLACGIAVVYEAPKVEMFQSLGLLSIMAWVTLTFLAMASNAAGVVISRVERYHKFNYTVQKFTKGILAVRMPALCVASYRAGHARARRSPSRSSASKDSSGDGESDSGEGDPPAPPSLSSLPLRPYRTFIRIFYKLNNFPLRFLYGFGCWRLPFGLSLAGRRWGK